VDFSSYGDETPRPVPGAPLPLADGSVVFGLHWSGIIGHSHDVLMRVDHDGTVVSRRGTAYFEGPFRALVRRGGEPGLAMWNPNQQEQLRVFWLASGSIEAVRFQPTRVLPPCMRPQSPGALVLSADRAVARMNLLPDDGVADRNLLLAGEIEIDANGSACARRVWANRPASVDASAAPVPNRQGGGFVLQVERGALRAHLVTAEGDRSVTCRESQ